MVIVSRKFVVARSQKENTNPLSLDEDFQLIEEPLDEAALQEGEILVAAEYIMVTAGMRGLMRNMAVGDVIMGWQVAKVLTSRNPRFPDGMFVVGSFGWRTHSIINPDTVRLSVPLYPLPDIAPYDRSWALGVLGVPGNSAYFGFLEICQPKEGDVVVVTSASSGVGSLVGQIAKIKKCRTIAITSSDEKCDLVRRAYGFDEAINYKKQDVAQALRTLAPNGVDCYFDNVGGPISSCVIQAMKSRGRISVCGAASLYDDNTQKGAYMQTEFILKQLKMEGFVVYRWADRWQEGIDQMLQWLREGRLNYKQKVYEDFATLPQVLVAIMKSHNMAKSVVKVNEFS